MLATALATAWLFFLPADNVQMQFIQGLCWSACYGPSIPLLWSMIGDAVDFSEWKKQAVEQLDLPTQALSLP